MSGPLSRIGKPTCVPLLFEIVWRQHFVVYRTTLRMCEKSVGWIVANKGGGRRAERDEANEKANERCGQAERKPSKEEARMCSPSPESPRRAEKIQTPV